MALETTATFIGHNECYGLSEDKLKEAIDKLQAAENGEQLSIDDVSGEASEE